MLRFVSLVLVAFALIACGGGDDDDNASSDDQPPTATVSGSDTTPVPTAMIGSATTPVTTPSEAASATTAPEPAATEASDEEQSSGSTDGAPTNASEDFPDVRVPLEAGSSGEVGSMDPDPFAATSSRDENSKVKVTINEVLDPAAIEGTIFSPESGNRWFAINITMEATGSGIANTGVWTLATTDGAEYTNMFTLGDTPEITYGSIEPGATTEGLIVFEIPENAEVAWILMSPTIFVGDNLVFVSQ